MDFFMTILIGFTFLSIVGTSVKEITQDMRNDREAANKKLDSIQQQLDSIHWQLDSIQRQLDELRPPFR